MHFSGAIYCLERQAKLILRLISITEKNPPAAISAFKMGKGILPLKSLAERKRIVVFRRIEPHSSYILTITDLLF